MAEVLESYRSKEECRNHYSAPISTGSMVYIIDGSYTLTIKSDSSELIHEFEGLRQEAVKVIAVNVTVPTLESAKDSLSHANNCILKAPNGDIIFCSKLNIVNVKPLFEP